MAKRGSVLSITTKKGVSEMMSYALIVVLVLGLSVFVYAYLTLYAPKDRAVCSDDISLVMKHASCSVILEPKPECDIDKPTLDFAAVLENKGNHKISGAYLRLGAPENEVKELINQNKLFFTALSSGSTASGLLPGERTTFTTRYENPQSIAPGSLDFEVQPFVGTPEKFQVCEQSVVVQRVSCQQGNILPRVSLSATAPQGYVISDSSPAPIQFTITASDCDGPIAKAELLERRTLQSEGTENLYAATGTGPYAVTRSLTSTDYIAGEYVYTAVAYDDKGGKGISEPLVRTYTQNVPPTITLFEIRDLSGKRIDTATTATQIVLHAKANDADGTISEIKFHRRDAAGLIDYSGAERKPDDSYELQLSPQPVGSWMFEAAAVDNLGARTVKQAPLSVEPQPLPAGIEVQFLSGIHAASTASGIIVTDPPGLNGNLKGCRTPGSLECATSYYTGTQDAPTEVKVTVIPDDPKKTSVSWSAGAGWLPVKDDPWSVKAKIQDYTALYAILNAK